MVFFNNMNVPEYKLFQSRRCRNIRISITKLGTVRVSAPLKVRPNIIAEHVAKHTAWILEALQKQQARPISLFAQRSAKDFRDQRDTVKKDILERLHRLNHSYEFSWSSVVVRNQKSRWGSCTSRKVLNFNYLLGKLPEELRDYVIVHELCHLQEMNHGPRFWALVARTFPNYRELRKKLSTM